ncbi:hypothetical protein SPF06_11895 [Sinomonas sp. JGH33]|uniref:Uncharacterized protein n=1 Tax=Sinomonas terricola TaxID=3110330 RepID=A0ABU5T6Z9_9MICC|nr:hypothetical protein [Sinomonas sp. JGH33]MEA5455425.1 hypothetical protein [Sinomonas sp. JGH33]
MKKISHSSWNLRKSYGHVIVRTGSHCPVNGLWQPAESTDEPLFVFEGSIMPTHAGGSAEWMLVATGRRLADSVPW